LVNIECKALDLAASELVAYFCTLKLSQSLGTNCYWEWGDVAFSKQKQYFISKLQCIKPVSF